ncbi:Lsr2 protein [Arthrobacter sp. ok909]|uniref:histone-like nucleoid-structuring protein Lsr2 n=1 Tax=Arthrobacter sp. ok909 TaxID=1761746 RepID=UPI000881EDCC|nr:Lsr2 family protein [Arthrobacter sp. ok909]SDP43823.1 Lsr2 protein [Arthrobacter sp. ok909]
MARKIHVQLIDDLSGEDAQETIRFSVDGADYEIDLSADNAAELRGLLQRYAAKGRRLGGPSGRRAGRAVPMGRGETQKVRDWAAENGYNPSSRGRISQVIKQAYDAAQG